MNALDKIAEYQTGNAGMSTFIDNKLVEIQEALRNADWHKDENNLDWYTINLRIAWKLAEQLLQVVANGSPRKALEEIYLLIAEEVK